MLTFIILVVFLQGDPTSPTQSSVDAVTQVQQRFTAALLKRDAAEFETLLADDLVHISFEGQIANKTEYMEFFKQGAWKYTKYEPSKVVVKIVGNAAVVTGRVDRTILINNNEITGAFAFTHVWSRTGDSWRLTSSHVTTIPNR